MKENNINWAQNALGVLVVGFIVALLTNDWVILGLPHFNNPLFGFALGFIFLKNLENATKFFVDLAMIILPEDMKKKLKAMEKKGD